MKRLFITIAIGCCLFSIGIYFFHAYSERSLASLIYYNEEDIIIIGVTVDRTNTEREEGYDHYLDEQEEIEALLAFLANYQVKRVSQSYYQKQLLYGSQQEVFISHYSHNASVVFIGEAGVHVVNQGTYRIVNGPIDLSELENVIVK
ncbi:hypothetical protein MM326_19365 [Alkalihalobacillus sp. LMS6]|uniref:hypothetical protein n=1 Tax=Alkalihalobacillus sp. LMS6 TaxID=2924034 RepID=UPI0020D1D768|nr:hypothetical protein [Alkalihalobacillus sp. LMS6]UTR06206.1 hypothetical protein MM326_19365 [Alkalihalobacillus sp. LMS6]